MSILVIFSIGISVIFYWHIGSVGGCRAIAAHMPIPNPSDTLACWGRGGGKGSERLFHRHQSGGNVKTRARNPSDFCKKQTLFCFLCYYFIRPSLIHLLSLYRDFHSLFVN